MPRNWLDKFPDCDVFAALLRNLNDSEQIVRLASLRALIRVATIVHLHSRDEFLKQLTMEVKRNEWLYVFGAGFLPGSQLLPRASAILKSTDEEDRQKAQQVLERIIQQAELEIRKAHEPRAIAKAFKVISTPLDPNHFALSGRIRHDLLEEISPRFASYLVTSEFANLALLDFKDRTELHAAESENIGRQIQTLGRSFTPDIAALFQVYQSFFRHSMRFWINWLNEQKKEGLNIVTEMPPFFPLTEGPLAVSRQIEWAVSRQSLSRVVTELDGQLASADPRDRWAAANLIEWSARYHAQIEHPRFGGGSGPSDIPVGSDGSTSLVLRDLEVLEGIAVSGDRDWESPNYVVRSGDDNVIDAEYVDVPEHTHEEAVRYTDLTIFKDFLFPGDDSSTAEKLDETTPLAPSSPYTLEVAVRRSRTGIGATFDPLRPVTNPRKDREELTVYVLAESLMPSIEIDEPFTKIAWPYDTDSESAYFRLNVMKTGSDAGLIEVRLYDASLDLLDIVQLSLPIAAPGSAGMMKPWNISWPDDSRGDLEIAAQNPPRLLSIDVGFDATSQRHTFLFKFLENDKTISIPGSTLITSADIDKLLVKVRDFWAELVITNYATDLNVTRTTFRKYLGRLKDLGIEAWTLLFGSRYAAWKGASETIGELLSSLKPNEGARIQITLSNAENFVFPWNIVYPLDGGVAEVDPLEFWGARYQIEQVTAGPRSDGLGDAAIKLVFALDPHFADSAAQRDLMKAYASSSNNKLTVTDPISGMAAFFEELERDPAAHLYYFYCHGYTPSARNVFQRDGVKLLKERIEALPEDSPARTAFETLLNLTSKMNDEPWIYIGDSEIRESKLKIQKFFNKKRPLVFLNMCQSADLVPSLSSGLVRVFLDHNASAVIGTESPMTGVFANAFSKVFFDELFAGADVGTALWKARRRFLEDDMRNPLGLAYTLYGRAVARVGDGPIITGSPLLAKSEDNGETET